MLVPWKITALLCCLLPGFAQIDKAPDSNFFEKDIQDRFLDFDVGVIPEDGIEFDRFQGKHSLDLGASLGVAQVFSNGTLMVRFRSNTREQGFMTLFSLTSTVTNQAPAGLSLGLDGEGQLIYQARNAKGHEFRKTAGFGCLDLQWHTAAVTIGPRGFFMYMDGEPLLHSSNGYFFDFIENPNEMRLGVSRFLGEPRDRGFFVGDIDWARVHMEVFDHDMVREASDRSRSRSFKLAHPLPTIELSHDPWNRQVLVDREPGQYLGHVSTVTLPNQSTMLAAYLRGRGRGELVWKRSDDLGKTWSERLPSGIQLIEVPTLHRIGNRVLLIAGRPQRRGGFETRWLNLTPDGDLPEDARWSPTETWFAGRNLYGCVAGSSLLPLKTPDRYLMLFNDPWGRNLKTTLSMDREEEWTVPESYLPPETSIRHNGRPGPNLCEPCAIRSPDGKTIAVIYRAEARTTQSMISFSANEGKTFSRPMQLPSTLTGDRHVARYDLDGERLMITFRDHGLIRHVRDRGDWVAWVGTFDDLLRGRPGRYRVRIMDNRSEFDCGYAGIELDQRDGPERGTFVLTSYGHWEIGEPPYIMSTRFKLSELEGLLP